MGLNVNSYGGADGFLYGLMLPFHPNVGYLGGFKCFQRIKDRFEGIRCLFIYQSVGCKRLDERSRWLLGEKSGVS